MCHISCFGHTMEVLNCGSGICFSIMAIYFNLLQEEKCHAICLFHQLDVRLDKNIVPLPYKVITQGAQGGRQPFHFPPPSVLTVGCSLIQQCPLEDTLVPVKCLWTYSNEGQIQVFSQGENYSEYNVYVMQLLWPTCLITWCCTEC